MLRFLTQKLRSQSLNEVQPFHATSDDSDHDSGTESDVENRDIKDADDSSTDCQLYGSRPLQHSSTDCQLYGSRPLQHSSTDCQLYGSRPLQLADPFKLPHTPTPSDEPPAFGCTNIIRPLSERQRPLAERQIPNRFSGSADFDSHTPSPWGSSDFDQASSEDELVSIIDSHHPEKRKWSQANSRNCCNESQANSRNCYNDSSDSDDEVKDLFAPLPLCFSSAPPRGIQAQPPSPDMFLARVTPLYIHRMKTTVSSPRKRHRHGNNSPGLMKSNSVIHRVDRRPYLDFNKMLQKTLAKKQCTQSLERRTHFVKIRSLGPQAPNIIYPDPEVFSFRAISTAYSPLTPVEEPPPYAC